MSAVINGSADSTFSNGININSGKFTVDAATGAVTSAAGMTLAGAVSGITSLGCTSLVSSGAISGISLSSSAGFLNSGTTTARFQSTTSTAPAGSAGGGVEIYVGNILSYNRTSAALAPLQIDSSALTVGSSLSVTGIVTTTGSGAGVTFNRRDLGAGNATLYNPSGNLTLFNGGSDIGNFNNATGAYTATSDITRKKNINYVMSAGLILNALKPAWGHFKEEDDASPLHPMFIAQDVVQVVPRAVNEITAGETPILGVDYTAIIPLLTAGYQELAAKVAALELRSN